MKPQFQTVIFDFDYTLADSSRGVVECINSALVGMGIPAVSAEEARRTIGLSLLDTFVHLTGESPVQSNEFARLFVERADEVMADLTVLFDSVPEAVEMLRRRGFALGIVSTKFRYRIQSILRREGLLGSFDVIVGGEDVSRHKPDPEGLLRVMERLQSSPTNSVYVGDSLVDAETAKRARVPFIAVLSGITPRDAFDGYDVFQILERMSDMPGWIDTKFQVSPANSRLG